MSSSCEPRFPADFAVTVKGRDTRGNPFQQTAKIVNVSRRGGRLSGIRCLGGPGNMVRIIRGTESADFLVVWVNHECGLAGICCVDTAQYLWCRMPSHQVAARSAALARSSSQSQEAGSVFRRLHHVVRGCLNSVGIRT